LGEKKFTCAKKQSEHTNKPRLSHAAIFIPPDSWRLEPDVGLSAPSLPQNAKVGRWLENGEQSPGFHR
jgi:hypothetical protein